MARMVPTIILTYMPPSDAFPNPMVLGHAAENGAQHMHLLRVEGWSFESIWCSWPNYLWIIGAARKTGAQCLCIWCGGLDAQDP